MCVFILFVVSTLKLMLAPNMGGMIHVPQLVLLLFSLSFILTDMMVQGNLFAPDGNKQG